MKMKNFLKNLTCIIFVQCLFVLAQIVHSQSAKPSIDDCLTCHNDKDLSKVVKGKPVSLWVKKAPFTASVHGKMVCVECHKDFNPDDIPHKANIQPPECVSCHKDVAKKHTFHPQMAYFNAGSNKELFNCKGCHGTHDIAKPKTSLAQPGASNAIEFCGKCHKEEKQQHLKSEHYLAYLKNNPNAPTCTTCHSKPITKYWIKDEIELKEKQLQLCLSCHKNDNTGNAKTLKTINYENSNHGKAHAKGHKEAAACIDCHGIHNIMKSDSVKSNINRFVAPQLCRKCHPSIVQEFLTTAHGMALTQGNKDAPSCLTCHNEHNSSQIPPYDPKNLKKNYLKEEILIKNKMIYCAVCHSNDDFQKRNHLKTLEKAHDFLPNRDLYMQDVRCVECHSSNSASYMPHHILPQSKAIKNCVDCHDNDTWLLTRLSKHEKTKAKREMGNIKGAIFNDGGLTRSTFNLLFDSLCLIILGLMAISIVIHSLLRWYFRRTGGKK